jgi:peptide/nickel transport system substrate-binding protein
VTSVERVVELDGPLAPLWASLDTIEAADDHTVTITTAEPFGGVLTSLSRTPIILTGSDDVGTGPFALDSFTSGETLVLVGNDDYWGGAPALDRIEVRNIPEVSSRVTALLNGEIDFTWALPPDQFPEVDGADGVTFVTAPSYQHYYAWLNAQRPPFDNVAVRQAVAHAIDWDSIVEDLFPTIAERATAPIPPTVFGYGANEPYAYDPELARSLLAEAGLADGFTTSMQFAATCCPLIQELAQAIASDLSEVGIDVELLEKETGVWVEDLLALDWDMNLAFNVTTTGDANFTIGRLYTCAADRTGFCDEELDALIATAQSTIDDTARAEAWAAAGSYIWDQAIGLFPFDVDANYAMSSSVQGFEPDPSGNPEFASVSIA